MLRRSTRMSDFFARNLKADSVIYDAINQEAVRQNSQIELIASENITSPAVIAAQGSVLTNKYAEGYPGKRYYGGCEYVDIVERVAIERACELFGSAYANVQSHSGAQANGAVLMALLKPGDVILGMSLDAGGHLTHGAKPTLSGKWFTPVQYGVRESDGLIDYDQVQSLAEQHRPKLIIAGGSAIPRQIDFARFRQIADSVEAYLLVDMAHIAGLVAGGLHPSPVPHAHIVTSTTHKTLRGPRGGLILTNDEVLAKKINSAVFPGLQGGPLMHVIAGKAVAFGEALDPSFKDYAQQVVLNARALGAALIERGFDLVTGGTDTHLVLVDLRSRDISGREAEVSLEHAHLTCNKNGIPFDPRPPAQTSGIRLGSPAGTTRGFKEAEFTQVGHLIADVLDALVDNREDNSQAEAKARQAVLALTAAFPVYGLQAGSDGVIPELL
ncbi:serine hydroxymethyltransferase [Brevundimonas nasdae]|uniref:Serine hydroxymethyltransferase n=2 Tax=Brevundimonas nasdae TaxID=172043 RepID=A0ABX8THM2_9CAUL|nr:serine hydroxymethyltransferase [Brevundimonas nasdae]QYC15349.1 serine hydroxymethyltransferase [Brevundimonas nasdae]